MLGLFGALEMANRSLTAQRQGAEVAGHNLANVNNPGYARQRVLMAASSPINSEVGPEGTGVETLRITQLRNGILDRQIVAESSIRASLETQQSALMSLQSALGQSLDRQATGAEGAAAANGTGGQRGIAEDLSDFFNAFQSVSANPTSLAERQVLVMKSQNLAVRINAVSKRLDGVEQALNDQLSNDVTKANTALQDIARLNEQITSMEVGGRAIANDLRDARQKQIEDLSAVLKVNVQEIAGGSVVISAGGTDLIAPAGVANEIETYLDQENRVDVRIKNSAQSLEIGSGSLHGVLTVKEGELTDLRAGLASLTDVLLTEVNQRHKSGFDLKGRTGLAFFIGDSPTTIAVHGDLISDPGRIQAAAQAGATGDNRNALELAALGYRKFESINDQTVMQYYGQQVSALGQALASTNTQLDNQTVVERMLLTQRDSLGGVSVDEEMMDLIKFQKAFEASARLVVTLSEMLETVVNLKR